MINKTVYFTIGLLAVLVDSEAGLVPITPAATTVLDITPQTYTANVVQSVSDSRGFAYSTVQGQQVISPIGSNNVIHPLPLRYEVNPLQYLQFPSVGGIFVSGENPYINSNLLPVQQFETSVGSVPSGNINNISSPSTTGGSSNTDDDTVTIEAN